MGVEPPNPNGVAPNFSVSQSNLEQVKEYIARQEEHYRKMTFPEELWTLLRNHRVEWMGE